MEPPNAVIVCVVQNITACDSTVCAVPASAFACQAAAAQIGENQVKPAAEKNKDKKADANQTQSTNWKKWSH
jgi:hypothetical protein